ncbi:MAG: hypothetical protein WC969_01310 [Elusimicrobiota bacterium]
MDDAQDALHAAGRLGRGLEAAMAPAPLRRSSRDNGVGLFDAPERAP